MLDSKLQAHFRILVAKKLKQIVMSYSQNTAAKRQNYILNNINKKLDKGHAMNTKADKGKMFVIIYTEDYKKVRSFLNDNNYLKLQKDPTPQYQKLINTTLQDSDLIVKKKQIKLYMQKKPLPPNLRAQIKLRKPGHPIRPAVNNMNAPTYLI